MAIYDFNSLGGGMAPSEPFTPQNQALPTPPINIPGQIGSFLGGLGNLGSQALFHRSPDQVGQEFSDFGSTINSGLSSFNKAVEPYASPQPLTAQGFLEDGLPPLQLTDPNSALFRGAKLGGAFLNQGLQKVEQFTAPGTALNPKATNPLTTGVNIAQDVLNPIGTGVHSASILGQGVGNLLQDAPQLDKMVMDSFQQGLSTTLSNDPNADKKNRDAVDQLMNAMSMANSDLFNPELMHQSIYDGFKTNGADDNTAKSAATMLAEPISTLASFLTPNGVARMMLVQFVGNLINHPSETIDSVKQSGGDFFNLLGTTASWMFRGGRAPSAQEVSLGVTGLAQSLGTLAIAHGIASEGFGAAGNASSYASQRLAARNIDRLQKKALGQTSTGADEMANAVGEAAMSHSAESLSDPNTINFGGDLATPEYAGMRNAVANASIPSDIEIADAAQELGGKAYPPGTPSDRMGGYGFLLKDGTYTELPPNPEGYPDHSYFLEDIGVAHAESKGQDAVARFLKDTGALKVEGRTDFGSYGLPPEHLQAIADTLHDLEDRPNLLATVEDVKSGRAYTFEINDLRSNNWNLQQTLEGADYHSIPKVGDNGPEDIQQTAQAAQAGLSSQASTAGQISQAGTAQATSGISESSQAESAIAPTAGQANQGVQGEGIPASNAQSVPSQLEFVGGHADGIPDQVRSSVDQLLKNSGINADGFVNSVIVDHNPGVNVYGSWSPFVDPRMIHLDLPNMGNMGAIEAVHNLRTDLNSRRLLVDAQLKGQGLEALKRQGLTPESAKNAFDEAERVLSDAAKNLRPDTMIQWIAAHEALHATLGKIYGYPPDGLPDTHPGSNGNPGRLVEGIHMISHMDSTPEGKAWLDHTATQMGLKGEVGQLRMLTRQAGNLRGADLYDSLRKMLTVVQSNKIALAEEAVNEALVHSVLNGKDLSPYPYWQHSGDKAHAISFYKPETTKENARLATAYYEKYRSDAVPQQLATATGIGDAGLSAGQRAAARPPLGNPDDQARIKTERDANIQDWGRSLSRINDDITNLLRPDGSPLDKVALDRLKLNRTLLSDRLTVAAENRDMSVRDIIRMSNDRLRRSNPELFEPKPAPQGEVLSSQGSAVPKKITPETAKQMVGEVKQAQAARQEPPKAKAKTLAEINALSPAPKHYMDERLTDLDRDKLARTSISQINRIQRAIDTAQSRGDSAAVDKLTIQKGAVGAFWKQFFAERPKDVVEPVKVAQPVDYHQEAGKIASYSSSHPLAPLKGLAEDVVQSSAVYDRAVEAGATPADLANLQGKMQWDMTRFRSAHDLYTSPAFKNKIDKQGYDWRQTRKIANRVSEIKATPNEKAKIVAKLIGEQLLKRTASNPYTLAEAGDDLRKTALGISKVAKNWHPEVKKALAGELWNVARQGWQEDPTLPFGVKNIPVHDLMQSPDMGDIANALKKEQDDFNNQFKDYQIQLSKAKLLETSGKLAKGTVVAMEKAQKAKNLQFSNERVRLQSIIDNHPQTAATRSQNFLGLTQDEIKNMPLPSSEAAKAAMGENPNANIPIEQLIADAEALNARIAAQVPNPFSLESFVDEVNPSSVDQSGGRSVGQGPNNGQPWFTPGWAKALTDLREMGGSHELLGDLTQDLLMKMGDHLDPTRSMFHPMQWFRAHWEAVAGIPYRVHQIENVLQSIIHDSGDPSFSKAILKSIDDQNIANHLREIGMMTPEQAKLAVFMNEYFKSVREQFKDPQLGTTPLIGQFIDNYVPHIVLKDPDGNDLFNAKKNMWSRNSGFAKERIQSGINGEPIFKTLQDLEDKGYKVEWNLDKVFAAHANSTFRMMKLREMFNTLRGSIYNSPDGKFSGFPIVHINDLAALKKDTSTYKGLEIFDTPQARIRFGPGDSMFQQYRVHPELARYIERLASMNDLKLPGMAPARFLRSLGGIFKFIQFSINPRHAFNIFSNIANLHSPAGVLSPTVWTNIYGRANRAMMPVDRSGLYNLTHKADIANTNRLLRSRAANEARMRDLFETMQREGFDPLDPLPTSMTPREADLREQYAQQREDLVQIQNRLDQELGVRDRRLLSNLMDKGLVPDRDLIEGADLNSLSNFAEKIPGMAQFHKWMWHDVVWRGQLGTAMHLADQFTMKAAKKYGWDGTGGAAAAERYVDPDLMDAIHREAIYYSKQATGILNKLDMSTNWQVYGRATLLSAPWTMGQLQAARDMVGNNKFSQLLGRQDFTQVSDAQLASGFGKDKARYLDDMHTKLARRMVFAGAAKLMMTSMIMSTIGSWMYTGNMQTPIQNFLKDPMHTFDIYAGRDPATGNAMWVDNPLYGFQRELVSYALAGIKAAMEHKSVAEIGAAPLVRFSYKENPMINFLIDMVTGTEVGRYLNGMDPAMSSDQDLQNLHGAVQPALDRLGIPDFGSNEDRLMYALRIMLPSPGGLAQTAVKRDSQGVPILDETGHEIPLTDPRSILNDFGIGGFLNPVMDVVNALPIPNSPAHVASIPGAIGNIGEDLGKLALFAAGTSQTTSNPLYDADISKQGLSVQVDPHGYFPEADKRAQSAANHEANISHELALVKIGNLAAQGTPEAYAQIGQIRDQNGLTDSQVIDAITHSTSVLQDDGVVAKSQGIVGKQPASGIVTINGRDLTEQQSVEYNKVKNTRSLYAIQQLQNSALFKTADSSTRLMLISQIRNLSDKFTTAQAGQEYQGIGGQPLTDAGFKSLLNNAITGRNDIQILVQSTDSYQAATPNDKMRMLQSYIGMADTLAWNQQFGDMKGLTQDQYRNLVINSVQTESQALDYLRQSPFYQNGTPEDQISMEREYSNLAKQMNVNVYNGKTNAMNPVEIPMYMRSVINTEETAKYLLHQSDFYASSSLTQQQSLDSKYANYARSLALKDWQKGQPILNINQAGQSFSVGPEQLIVGHLMAEQGYNDLMNQYGGAQTIQAYQQQLSDMKKQVRENIVATPAQLSRMQTILGKQFEAANPQYAAFLKARTAWERGTTIGRLYLSLNADEQALATVDTSVIADSTDINAGNILNQSIDDSGLYASGGSDLTPMTSTQSLFDTLPG